MAECVACGGTTAVDGKCYVCEQGGVHDDPRWAWEVFVETRPDEVKQTIERFKIAPNRIYHAPDSPRLFQVGSFVTQKDGTVRVTLVDVESGERIKGVDPSEIYLHSEVPWDEFKKLMASTE